MRCGMSAGHNMLESGSADLSAAVPTMRMCPPTMYPQATRHREITGGSAEVIAPTQASTSQEFEAAWTWVNRETMALGDAARPELQACRGNFV